MLLFYHICCNAQAEGTRGYISLATVQTQRIPVHGCLLLGDMIYKKELYHLKESEKTASSQGAWVDNKYNLKNQKLRASFEEAKWRDVTFSLILKYCKSMGHAQSSPSMEKHYCNTCSVTIKVFCGSVSCPEKKQRACLCTQLCVFIKKRTSKVQIFFWRSLRKTGCR